MNQSLYIVWTENNSIGYPIIDEQHRFGVKQRAFIQRKQEFKKTLLKKGCTVGANVTIVCGITIGEYALIGSGAVVNKDVKPYALMVGVPAKQIGWVGISGNTLNFKEGQAEDEFAIYEIVADELKVRVK